jgi:geranylgeranyl pyrophosphate synthase
MKSSFSTQMADRAQYISGILAQLESPIDSLALASLKTHHHSGIGPAIRYALINSGKRVRPFLAFAAAEASGARSVEAIDMVACSLELIHTYSLIHDDLPAMDDDDLRRGKPSLHKAYDEATAILVGDGLQARAFELLAEAPGLSDGQKIAMIKVLAAAAGPRGMVGGQFIDIQATNSDMTLEQLRAMHSLKTGALIRAALALGGIAAGATERQLSALDEYGTHIGLAFQVVDDILDVEGDTQTLGKTRGKDGEANKPTYVKLMGLEGAKTEARRLLQAALDAIHGFGASADHLRDLAHYIVERDR